jgi:DNA polymerase-1
MPEQKKRLIIIDANSIIHRAFHALPPLTTKKGELVNAVYGFLLVFLKAIREFKPDFVAAAFDLPGPTFRHERFKEYKATRPKTAEGICEQLPKVKEVLNAFNVSIFEKEGLEADDIIATIEEKTGNETENIILSGDSDTLQLVDKDTGVYMLRKGVKDTVLYDENLVREKYQGLTPDKLVDYKALRGDPTDNIPGVRGVGEKTAISLILKFDNLEKLYREIEENSEKAGTIPPKIKELLIKYKDQAFLSKTLAQLERKGNIDFDLEECRWQKFDKKKAKEIFEKFEFESLIKRLDEI